MLIANLGRNALRDREVMHGDLPSLRAPLRVVGREPAPDLIRGRGVEGLSACSSGSEFAEAPPTPDPSPPLLGREGEETVRDGGLFENRISTAYAVRNNGGSDGRISANATSGSSRHHAIAAVVFCAVERGVGALEHVGDRLALQLQRR
jgi:hypothetical protein